MAEYWSTAELPDIEKVPDHISYARHALALHERRGEMEPTLWKNWGSLSPTPAPLPPRVMQCWFPGAHSDVGGGYADSKLAEAPLAWMRNEASACTLQVRQVKPCAGKRILHQERTANALVGAGARLHCGEGPRKALSKFANLDPQADAQLIESFFVHQTACDQLRDPIAEVEFVNYPPVFLPAQDSGKRELKQIDQMTLQMFLELRTLGKIPNP